MRLNHDLQFYVILDNIRSIENVGSIFRTGDALGVAKIFLGGISGMTKQGTQRALHPKISKTALGAEKRVAWEHCGQTWKIIEQLRKGKLFSGRSFSKQEVKIQIVALETRKNAADVSKFKPRFPLALILGNEVSGVSSAILKRCDKIVEIPMFGEKESLNVAVAFGIAGFELNKFRQK